MGNMHGAQTFGDNRIHQMAGRDNSITSAANGCARSPSPFQHNMSVKQLYKPKLIMNRGKQLKKVPSSTTSRRVEKVNVFRDPSRMCGLGCMVERENEYDNASELDLSATSSPLKLKAKDMARHTARPFEQRANSPLSLASQDQNLSMYRGHYAGYHPGVAGSPQQRFMEDYMPNNNGGPIGADSVVTVINLRRAHSPCSNISPSDKPMAMQPVAHQ